MLILGIEFVERIREHSVQVYPEECCGFLFGRSDGEVKSVSELLKLTNSSGENRSRRYIVTPEEFRDAEVGAERSGLEVLGIYHSHPDHPSTPSQFDLEHALPWWSYVIIAIERGVPSAMSSWVMKEDRSAFEEEKIEWGVSIE